MKTTNPSPPARRGYILGILNTVLAIVLTLISFRYVQPINCYRSCPDPYKGEPCLPGECHFGEQKAGWPLPVFVDMPGGGSPTNGWGVLGPEDIPSPLPLLLDVFFYSAIVWLVIYILKLVQRQGLHPRTIVTSLPMDLILAAGLWLFYMLFPYALPIGRGQLDQVYVNTPKETLSSDTFAPIVPIRLEELIRFYGDPGQVWVTAGDRSNATYTLIHWPSVGVYAELSPMVGQTHVINRTSDVKRIFFSDEPQILTIDEKPLGKNVPWTGFGEYQP